MTSNQGAPYETGSDGAAGRPPGAVFLNKLDLGPLGRSLFRAKLSILEPIRAILDDLRPNQHCGPDLDLQDQAGDGPLEWVRPVPKAPERSWHASGPSFRPNRRFSTHFGPNLMFLDGKPDPLSETSTSVLSQQQASVLSQQQTSVLSQQQPSAHLRLPGYHDAVQDTSCQKPLTFCVFELATPYSTAE